MALAALPSKHYAYGMRSPSSSGAKAWQQMGILFCKCRGWGGESKATGCNSTN